jgi:hypothetical protein
MQPSYGWAHDQENHAALDRSSFDAWRSAVRGQYQAAEEIDPRGWFHRRDQQRQGACAGFALSGSGQFNYRLATGETREFSQQFAYIETQRRDGLLGQDRGSTIEGGEWVARNIGFAAYNLWPYSGQYVTAPPRGSIDGVRHDAHSRLIQTTATLRSYDEIFEWLAAGLGCVQIGILWNDSMNAGPVIQSYDATRSGGGHSVLLAGYSKRVDAKGRKALWLANWWGETWGQRGWAEVMPAAVEGWFKNRFTVIRGHSDLAGDGVHPRPVDWVAGTYKHSGRYESP